LSDTVVELTACGLAVALDAIAVDDSKADAASAPTPRNNRCIAYLLPNIPIGRAIIFLAHGRMRIDRGCRAHAAALVCNLYAVVAEDLGP
jgi:hypothetical protein